MERKDKKFSELSKMTTKEFLVFISSARKNQFENHLCTKISSQETRILGDRLQHLGKAHK